MHIYSVMDAGPVGCVVPEVPVLIFKSYQPKPTLNFQPTPNYRAGSELVGKDSAQLIGHM